MTTGPQKPSTLRPPGGIFRRLPRGVRWGGGTVAALLLALFIVSYFLDEPLRRSMETRMNSHLKGYTVRVPKLHVQLVGGSLTLKGMTVTQQAHPVPPIALFPELRASVSWREVLTGRLVAEFDLDRPEVHVNLQQLSHEAASTVPLKAQGWQQAVEAVYPLKINALTIHDGSITYIDQDPKRPLHLSRLDLQASNIRNVRLPDKVYPSTIHLETAIFGSGRGVIDGRANFLGEPYPGLKGRFTLEKVPLAFLAPVITRANLAIRNGLFSSSGEIEYAPTAKSAHVEGMTIQGMDIDYVHTARTAAAEKQRAAAVGTAARKVGKAEMQVRLDQLKLAGCTVGLVNQAARTPYRVFLTDADLKVSNLSNRSSQGPGMVELQGKFMGSGNTNVTASFRQGNVPSTDLHVKIEGTRMTAMNDLFRAYGDFDVTAGEFSFYSELHVRGDAVSGYVKPFFKGVKIYDRRQDKEKRLSHRMYEMLVSGVAALLKNRPTGEIATQAEISGTVSNPRISNWQVIGRLIKNAFFKALLPGFEKGASRGER